MVACTCNVSVVELNCCGFFFPFVVVVVVVEIFDSLLTIFVHFFIFFKKILQTNQSFGTLKLSSLCTSAL